MGISRGTSMTLAFCAFLVLAMPAMVELRAGHDGPGVTADDAQTRLKEGNQRFVAGSRQFARQDQARRIETALGQNPFVTVLSCADSRVPPEHLFDAGIGDLFVIRVAGNVADHNEIATVEYGTEHLRTALVVVMGHTKCGAVTAVAKGAPLGGQLPFLAAPIKIAVQRARKELGPDAGDGLVDAAITHNVWHTIESLIVRSGVMRHLIATGKVRIVGARYHLDSGVVDWLGEHPDQARLMGGHGAKPAH